MRAAYQNVNSVARKRLERREALCLELRIPGGAARGAWDKEAGGGAAESEPEHFEGDIDLPAHQARVMHFRTIRKASEEEDKEDKEDKEVKKDEEAG